MKISECSLKIQISHFKNIREAADQAYADLINDTTEENRRTYQRCIEDFLYAQLMLLTRLRNEDSDKAIELESGTLVWDDDWPHWVHIINDYGRDRCDRCHGQKWVEFQRMWVECPECHASGKEFVTLYFPKKSKAS